MKSKIFTFVFAFFCFSGFSVFASIDTGNKIDECPAFDMNLKTDSQTITPAGPCLEVQPLYLDRDIGAIKCFSSLPGNIQLTLKQSYPENGLMWCDFSKTFNRYPFVIEPFIQTARNSVSSDPLFSYGINGTAALSNMEFRGKIAYEDRLASSIVSSPALKVLLTGGIKFDSSILPKINMAMEYSGSKGGDCQPLPSELCRNNIYSPDDSNISVMNIALACSPVKNMFMSVEYYYYLQDTLQIQSFSKNPNALNLPNTNGDSKNLGHELDFRTVIAFTDFMHSEFFAGGFKKGSAYSNNDDNKTFEIKGEIVVNF